MSAPQPRYALDGRRLLSVLGRGHDKAQTMGELQDITGWGTRRIYHATRALRLAGEPLCSGSDGYWISDDADMDTTIASLHRRLVSQYLTLRELRRTRRAMGDYQQTTLWTDAA